MRSLIPFIKLFRSQTQWMLLGTLLAWSAILMGIGLMSLSGWFISYTGYLATTTYAIATSFNYFYPAAGVRSFSLGRIVSRYGERVLTHEATFRILTDVRVWFYEKLEPLAPSHLHKYKSGDLLTRLVNDIAALDNLYVRILSPTIVFILASVTIALLFCFFSFALALLTLIALLFIGFVIPLFSSVLAMKKSYNLNNTSAELKTDITEHVNSLAELKIFDLDGKHFEKIRQQNSNLLKQEEKISIISGLGSALMTLALGLTIVMVTIFAVKLTQNGNINGAFIALIFLAIMAAFESIMPLPLAYQYLGKTISASKRILNITDAKPDVEFSDTQVNVNQFNVEFKNVCFGYTSEQSILKDFSLEIMENQRIALFAPTGRGKSTIISLLARFWDINSGEILIGNRNIKEFSEDQLRNLMTIINQSPHIFNTTIRENLLLAKSDATDEELINTLEKVQLKTYLESLPRGLDTWTGELGKHLSGGQQKRLALARAFLQDKPILILDEPTEGLDKETEKLVFKNLQELMNNKTVIFITHNAKLLDSFDRVIKF
ncbi:MULTISPECIES: heme ABC transporter ATP-binding protein/permease CydC [unclassified Francisella]|uniref:heme ABC transporter ATP-binding protein/permease CydC n=1 Tax=unclassified Francisella TaxID=2610885 RepID=UPI002E300D77|nr:MULTISPECIES: cysteine/glutathione ABC transporter ATP-binding protein/permease CydC [unclassified Francisella]MED7818667.1 cysteine/glutathione ABC transporter ATP-binding protein/permease CydC [Francisella sp. 19S2-4]MED7829503.1 cysteine/glutathione ABC transporter ATP-binding protein/permease CydC [Francisella sp. 19S2-10]